MKTHRIGIYCEIKEAEQRAPITPEDAKFLIAQGVDIYVQPSANRIFSEEEYRRQGAFISRDNLADCPVVFSVKEMDPAFFRPGRTYVFFSHTIKGQAYNMPMLRRLMDLKCQLIDYERIVTEDDRRLVYFGRHAGIGGMINTLSALGKRLAAEGYRTPLAEIEQANVYKEVELAEAAIRLAGEKIVREGLPEPVTPLVCGFLGAGNVARGAQEVYNWLPVQNIAPEELAALRDTPEENRHTLYQVSLRKRHSVRHKQLGVFVSREDYEDHPEAYESNLMAYLPYLSVLVNGIYWEEPQPCLVSKAMLETLYANGQPHLRVIGDISCDIDGSIESTVKSMSPLNPVFVYDPFDGRATDGVVGRGPVMMTVDNTASEVPRGASAEFSELLRPFVPSIARADYSLPFEQCNLPPEIRKAVIVYQGRLTPDYQYLSDYLAQL